MDSNYQWQKQRAGERHAARMREAQAHRMLKDNAPMQASQDRPGSDSLLSRLWRRLFGGKSQGIQIEGRELKPRTAHHPADSR